MLTLNKTSEEIANKLKSKDPSFDIILAITIAKLIYDIIVCFIKRNEDKEKSYGRYKKMGPVERIIIRSYIAKYFPRHSKHYEEVCKILIEEKFDKEIFEKVYDEVSGDIK